MSSNASNISSLNSIIKPRNKRLGLNLNDDQSTIAAPSNLKSEIVIIPAVSQPQFGSYFIFDVKERNCIISDLVINFNVSAISGISSASTNYPHFVPASFWMSKIELVINNVTIDTLYPLQLWTSQQFFNDDEDRILINNMQGNYASVAQRYTISSATSNYYVKLRSFYNECNIPILSDAHNLQVRVYMDSLANLVDKSAAGTGTAAATLNSANIICKVTKLPSEIASARLNAMIKSPEHNIFHNIRYSPFALASGASNSTIVLTPFVGNVAALFFTVRKTSELTGDNCYQFTKIKDFAILDSSSSNCVGGQVIPSALALQYLNNFYSKSSYSSETDIGCNIAQTVTDNKANLYCWSFSSNIVMAQQSGLLLGHKKMTGSEQLQINFTGSLAAAVQVDVWAYCQSAIEQSAGFVKVYAL
jgi:hypothetical protein